MKVKVDELLKEHQRSKYWLAKVTNITYSNISKICSGDIKSIKLKSLDKIATALDVGVEDILQIEEHVKTTQRLKDKEKKDKYREGE